MTHEDAYLCTPRDWEREALRVVNCLGAGEGLSFKIQAERFGLCANVIEAQARRIAELEAAMTRMAGEARELME